MIDPAMVDQPTEYGRAKQLVIAMLAVAVFLLAALYSAESVVGPFVGSVVVNHSGAWENRDNLDPDGILTLWWNSSRAVKENGTFSLLLEGDTHGYVGLGLSPFTGTMAGADMVVAWVDKNGSPHVRDYWADQNGSPTLDESQDWRILWSRENSTHTSVLITRAVVTGHTASDLPITPGPIRLIYSWSENDPDGAPRYHGKEQRGTKTLELLSKSTADQKIPYRGICLLLPLVGYLDVFRRF